MLFRSVQAQEEAERKVEVSPLEQFRRFVQDAQEAQRRQQQHQQEQRTIRTAPPVARPVTPPPARRVVQVVEAEGPSGEEGPSGKSLSEVLAQKDRAVVAEDHAAAQWNVAGRTIVEPASGRSQLAEVLASDRSDLAKAVLMREVLGRPLALRQGGLPISRA